MADSLDLKIYRMQQDLEELRRERLDSEQRERARVEAEQRKSEVREQLGKQADTLSEVELNDLGFIKAGMPEDLKANLQRQIAKHLLERENDDRGWMLKR